jgi:hypothetical protein
MIMDWEKESAGGELNVYPEGTYKICITGFEKVTASTGTPQIRWRASILSPVEFLNKPITIHTPLTEKSLWKLARLVKAAGLDAKALGKMEVNSPAFERVLERCKRRTSYWHLAVTPNNKGQERNEVDDFKVDNEQEQDQEIALEDVPEFLKE